MASRNSARPKGQGPFLAAMSETGNITVAAQAAKIDRRRHYEWLVNDPEYAAEFADAEQQAADLLEKAARQRAVEGWLEPVYYQGEEVGQVRKYSDTLLIFTLKGAKPEKYRERWQGSLTGPDGGPVQHEHRIDLTQLSDQELEIYARLIAKASSNALPSGDTAGD